MFEVELVMRNALPLIGVLFLFWNPQRPCGGLRRLLHGADVEVLADVLDGNVQGVGAPGQVLADGLDAPIA